MYYEETMQERGFSDKIKLLDAEIKKLKGDIKTEQTSSLLRIKKQKSVNNATLLLEKKYRDLCDKHGYKDNLKVVVSRGENNTVTDVDISAKQWKKINRRDPSKPRIKNVDSGKFFKGRLGGVKIEAKEQKRLDGKRYFFSRNSERV